MVSISINGLAKIATLIITQQMMRSRRLIYDLPIHSLQLMLAVIHVENL